MTLEAWVQPATASNDWRDVIYKGNDNYYLEASSTTSGWPAGGSIFDGTHGEVFGTGALAPGSWTHLALTYDGSMLRHYVNGVEVSSADRVPTIASSAEPLEIGRDSIYGQYFYGLIDEVASTTSRAPRTRSGRT